MAKIPVWALGRHVTAFTLTPQTVASDGTLADATPSYTLYGHLQDVEIETSVTFENISAMDRPFENNVPVEVATIYRCTELEKNSATPSYLAEAMYVAPSGIFKITLTRGGKTWTGYGIIANYRMNATKPRVTGTFEIRMIDVGAANPVYA